MRILFLVSALAVSACQTAGGGVGGYGSLVTTGAPLALATEPDCAAPADRLAGSWCKLRYLYAMTGKADPCSGLSGRVGHDCRHREVRGYADPVNNPAQGDFLLR